MTPTEAAAEIDRILHLAASEPRWRKFVHVLDALNSDRNNLIRKLALYRARVIEAYGHDVLECGGVRLCQKCRDNLRPRVG
jgi:hypothetical protein